MKGLSSDCEPLVYSSMFKLVPREPGINKPALNKGVYLIHCRPGLIFFSNSIKSPSDCGKPGNINQKRYDQPVVIPLENP